MKKAKITLEMEKFFASTGLPASALSRESGVHPARISVLLSGKQGDTLSETADALRAAMDRLMKASPTPEQSQSEGGDA